MPFTKIKKPGALENYVLPALAMVVIVLADQHIESVLLTPMLSVCVLALMIFRLKTSILAFWVAVYGINVLYSLIDGPGGVVLSTQVIVVRAVSYLVVATIILLASRVQKKLARNNQHLTGMLDRLPCAVVLSDRQGTVKYSNDRASILLETKPSAMVGHSFFNFFSFAGERGADVRSYLQIAEGKVSHETLLNIHAGKVKKTLSATQIPITLGETDYLLTAIDNDGELNLGTV